MVSLKRRVDWIIIPKWYGNMVVVVIITIINIIISRFKQTKPFLKPLDHPNSYWIGLKIDENHCTMKCIYH
jgi:hypothetical protein